MSSREPLEGEPPRDQKDGNSGFRCDFCGLEVASVKRVALDGDYERLRTPHNPRYACPECSERKERERLETVTG